jgi:transcriptional regulator with XRE-family HTH domain
MPIDYKVIGNRIKKERKQSKLSQEELAECLGISSSFQSRMERGATKISLDMLGRISETLDISLSLLVAGVADSSCDFLDEELSSAIEDFTPLERRLLLDIVKSIRQNRP